MKRIESPFLKYLFYTTLGGMAYWTVDGISVLLAYISPRVMIVTKSIMLPGITIYALHAVVRIWTIDREKIIGVALLMVLGIWIFSPVYMVVMSLFSENGPIGFQVMGWLFVAFPMTAIVVSTYSGGLLGLFISSICIPVAAIFFSREKRSPA